MLCCGAVARCVSHDAHLATAPQHIPTQHDMLPQHLICKYELNCEYCNITLARNKAPWWWCDKIETCRIVLECFMGNYMCIRWFINWSDSKWVLQIGGRHLPVSGNNVVRSTARKTHINAALSVAERAVQAVAMQHDYYECVPVLSRPDTVLYLLLYSSNTLSHFPRS